MVEGNHRIEESQSQVGQAEVIDRGQRNRLQMARQLVAEVAGNPALERRQALDRRARVAFQLTLEDVPGIAGNLVAIEQDPAILANQRSERLRREEGVTPEPWQVEGTFKEHQIFLMSEGQAKGKGVAVGNVFDMRRHAAGPIFARWMECPVDGVRGEGPMRKAQSCGQRKQPDQARPLQTLIRPAGLRFLGQSAERYATARKGDSGQENIPCAKLLRGYIGITLTYR